MDTSFHDPPLVSIRQRYRESICHVSLRQQRLDTRVSNALAKQPDFKKIKKEKQRV